VASTRRLARAGATYRVSVRGREAAAKISRGDDAKPWRGKHAVTITGGRTRDCVTTAAAAAKNGLRSRAALEFIPATVVQSTTSARRASRSPRAIYKHVQHAQKVTYGYDGV